MPPRHAYWTIIVDDQPTSFRAHDVEELLPTFNRLREKHPNAQLKWFERGQLWESRDAAREQGFGQGERRWEGPRPSREGAVEEPRRDAKWRPGGEHRDPRQKYKDAKKAKWDGYKQKIRSRWEEKQRPQPDKGEHTPPHGDAMRSGRGESRPEWRPDDRKGDRGQRPERREDERREWRPRPEGRGQDDRRSEWRPREERGRDDRREGWRPREERREDTRSDRGAGGSRKPWGSRAGSSQKWGAKPAGGSRKPWGDRPAGAAARKPWSGKPAGTGPRKPWGDKPAGSGARKPWGDKPAGSGPRKPWGDKPAGSGARKPWGSKPAGAGTRKPWGGKPAAGGARKSWGGKPAGGGFGKKPFGSGPPRGPRRPKKRGEDEE